MDPEEIMRRVPGITRKEAEFITKVKNAIFDILNYLFLNIFNLNGTILHI